MKYHWAVHIVSCCLLALQLTACGADKTSDQVDNKENNVKAKSHSNKNAHTGKDRTGVFDFYVLSLSWSPSYCAAEQGKGPQCGINAAPGFIVHGLWPQYERGWPRDCTTEEVGPFRQLIDSMLDIMPSPGLVRHEWKKHGTCSGLSSEAYFQLVRQAREHIIIPTQYRDVHKRRKVRPIDVEEAFIKANKGLADNGVAVTCDRKRLREVRICMTKDLQFRDCAQVNRQACRVDQTIMPARRIR